MSVTLPTLVKTLDLNFCEQQLCDRDTDVDGIELSILVHEMGGTDCGTVACEFDLNSDGVVDDIDLFLFGEDFGR